MTFNLQMVSYLLLLLLPLYSTANKRKLERPIIKYTYAPTLPSIRLSEYEYAQLDDLSKLRYLTSRHRRDVSEFDSKPNFPNPVENKTIPDLRRRKFKQSSVNKFNPINKPFVETNPFMKPNRTKIKKRKEKIAMKFSAKKIQRLNICYFKAKNYSYPYVVSQEIFRPFLMNGLRYQIHNLTQIRNWETVYNKTHSKRNETVVIALSSVGNGTVKTVTVSQVDKLKAKPYLELLFYRNFSEVDLYGKSEIEVNDLYCEGVKTFADAAKYEHPQEELNKAPKSMLFQLDLMHFSKTITETSNMFDLFMQLGFNYQEDNALSNFHFVEHKLPDVVTPASPTAKKIEWYVDQFGHVTFEEIQPEPDPVDTNSTRLNGTLESRKLSPSSTESPTKKRYRKRLQFTRHDLDSYLGMGKVRPNRTKTGKRREKRSSPELNTKLNKTFYRKLKNKKQQTLSDLSCIYRKYLELHISPRFGWQSRYELHKSVLNYIEKFQNSTSSDIKARKQIKIFDKQAMMQADLMSYILDVINATKLTEKTIKYDIFNIRKCYTKRKIKNRRLYFVNEKPMFTTFLTFLNHVADEVFSIRLHQVMKGCDQSSCRKISLNSVAQHVYDNFEDYLPIFYRKYQIPFIKKQIKSIKDRILCKHKKLDMPIEFYNQFKSKHQNLIETDLPNFVIYQTLSDYLSKKLMLISINAFYNSNIPSLTNYFIHNGPPVLGPEIPDHTTQTSPPYFYDPIYLFNKSKLRSKRFRDLETNEIDPDPITENIKYNVLQRRKRRPDINRNQIQEIINQLSSVNPNVLDNAEVKPILSEISESLRFLQNTQRPVSPIQINLGNSKNDNRTVISRPRSRQLPYLVYAPITINNYKVTMNGNEDEVVELESTSQENQESNPELYNQILSQLQALLPTGRQQTVPETSIKRHRFDPVASSFPTPPPGYTYELIRKPTYQHRSGLNQNFDTRAQTYNLKRRKRGILPPKVSVIKSFLNKRYAEKNEGKNLNKEIETLRKARHRRDTPNSTEMPHLIMSKKHSEEYPKNSAIRISNKTLIKFRKPKDTYFQIYENKYKLEQEDATEKTTEEAKKSSTTEEAVVANIGGNFDLDETLGLRRTTAIFTQRTKPLSTLKWFAGTPIIKARTTPPIKQNIPPELQKSISKYLIGHPQNPNQFGGRDRKQHRPRDLSKIGEIKIILGKTVLPGSIETTRPDFVDGDVSSKSRKFSKATVQYDDVSTRKVMKSENFNISKRSFQDNLTFRGTNLVNLENSTNTSNPRFDSKLYSYKEPTLKPTITTPLTESPVDSMWMNFQNHQASTYWNDLFKSSIKGKGRKRDSKNQNFVSEKSMNPGRNKRSFELNPYLIQNNGTNILIKKPLIEDQNPSLFMPFILPIPERPDRRMKYDNIATRSDTGEAVILKRNRRSPGKFRNQPQDPRTHLETQLKQKGQALRLMKTYALHEPVFNPSFVQVVHNPMEIDPLYGTDPATLELTPYQLRPPRSKRDTYLQKKLKQKVAKQQFMSNYLDGKVVPTFVQVVDNPLFNDPNLLSPSVMELLPWKIVDLRKPENRERMRRDVRNLEKYKRELLLEGLNKPPGNITSSPSVLKFLQSQHSPRKFNKIMLLKKSNTTTNENVTKRQTLPNWLSTKFKLNPVRDSKQPVQSFVKHFKTPTPGRSVTPDPIEDFPNLTGLSKIHNLLDIIASNNVNNNPVNLTPLLHNIENANWEKYEEMMSNLFVNKSENLSTSTTEPKFGSGKTIQLKNKTFVTISSDKPYSLVEQDELFNPSMNRTKLNVTESMKVMQRFERLLQILTSATSKPYSSNPVKAEPVLNLRVISNPWPNNAVKKLMGNAEKVNSSGTELHDKLKNYDLSLKQRSKHKSNLSFIDLSTVYENDEHNV